ncbi:MAG: trehalose-6-phosphate synthase [Planctomycetes bacterium]|nr:trehalose-6-phosphate synthase [Planctomycetota bacterium]
MQPPGATTPPITPTTPRPHEGRLIVVANRLPVSRSTDPGNPWKTSPGGLVSALAPLLRSVDGAWVGWGGISGEVPEPFHHEGLHLHPVGLDEEELETFYQGFCNTTLWPLYHDCVRWPEFRRRWWAPYVKVNERFAEATCKTLGHGDTAWIHDYHLQLVPKFVRESRPDAKIGFFSHIPFPPIELFAQIPWRRQILEGLLGADLLGFQTIYGAKNFVRAVRRFTHARGTSNTIEFEGRRITVGGFPISIDVQHYRRLAAMPKVQEMARTIRKNIGPDKKIFLGVDRLDYTKGIDRRLRAFETLLQQLGPDAQKVAFIQLAVPSRELVPQYAQIRNVVEQHVGRINGDWGTPHHIPVHYMYRSLPADELVAHYLAADVMAVTPLRDGMNLVAKEFVASRLKADGVLVLSEFTGAAQELKRALLVNPHDIDGMANAFRHAMEMPDPEVRQRMSALLRVVGKNDVHVWADNFLGSLEH